MAGQKKFAPSSFGAFVGSGIRDEQKSGSGIRNTGLIRNFFYERATRPYAESTHKRKN
jgi:hypothetical protein